MAGVRYFICVLVMLLPCLLGAEPTPAPAPLPMPVPAPAAASQPATRPAGVFRGYAGAVDDANAPGFHKLVYEWAEDGNKREIPFSLYLPEGYGSDDRRWPMLTFMGGLGDRGPDPGVAMGVGVPLEIGRDLELRRWMPMMVLTPQCPSDKVWDTPGMSQVVVRLIRAVSDCYAVDSSRLYVTGFSDGGKGTWVVTALEPRMFAAAAPVVSREYQAEETAQRLDGTGTTCLVISGQVDPKSEPASSHMVEALRKHGVDVAYAPIPNGQHFIWSAFYREKEFYQWLLMHQRGAAAPKERPGGERFVQLYQARSQSTVGELVFDHRLQRELDTFEPYWWIDNCERSSSVGLRRQVRGRPNVYMTRPISAEVPCRLQTTRQLPKNKWTRLTLEVGHPPKGEWELVVRVNEEEQGRMLVNDETAPNGWLEMVVNLQLWAGKEVRLQLIQQTVEKTPPTGYWAKIKLTETDPK